MQQDLSLDKIINLSTNCKYLANLSVNSLAGVRFTIAKNLDPFSRLRQCEQIIFEKTGALEENWLKCRKQDRAIATKIRKLAEFKKSENPLSFEELHQVEDIEDELLVEQRQKERVEVLIRDAVMELQVALEEKAVILQQNPNFSEASYYDLQSTYGTASFQNKIASNLAIKMLVAEGISEEIASVFIEMPEEERNAILEKSRRAYYQCKINPLYSETSNLPSKNVPLIEAQING